MARQHPGESPASYVVQGLIDFLVSKHKIAQELREKLIFKVIWLKILTRPDPKSTQIGKVSSLRRNGSEVRLSLSGYSDDEP